LATPPTLPEFTSTGDLPAGVYQATLSEIIERFGAREGQRAICTERLIRIYALAKRTDHLQSLIVFGSYITAKPEPNDIDIVLVMDDNFRWEDCPIESRG